MLLLAIVVLMWLVEGINSLTAHGRALDGDGAIYPRNFDHVWSIFTAPFLHFGWQHLIDNTIPFVFMGVIIALRGAARLALVTLIVIVIGGLGTWLIAPGGTRDGRRQRGRVRLRHLPVHARAVRPQPARDR